MRFFNCYYSALINRRWKENPNSACWAGIGYYNKPYVIRISEWKEPETERYALILVKVINKITPCWIENGYIYYTIIKNGSSYTDDGKRGYYDRNLILLNFIRYLWHNYNDADPKIFFEILKKSRYKDPFKRLSKANLHNTLGYTGWSTTPGHSNVDKRQKSIISLETFMNYESNCTGFFNR